MASIRVDMNLDRRQGNNGGVLLSEFGDDPGAWAGQVRKVWKIIPRVQTCQVPNQRRVAPLGLLVIIQNTCKTFSLLLRNPCYRSHPRMLHPDATRAEVVGWE